MVKRSTNAVVADRVRTLKQMILTGSSNSACVAFAADQWGVSARQTYRLLQRAWASIHDDVDQVGVDRREMTAWAIHQLQRAVGDALDLHNAGAAVGAVREMNLLLGLGEHNRSVHRR